MNFYDALQMDPAGLKKQIRSSDDPAYRWKMLGAMALRSLLLVIFSTLVISPCAVVFGSENSCMAVALLCILLGIRFVDLGYCIRDSLLNLAVVFALLWLAPSLAALLNPIWAIPIHVSAFFVILYMTSQHPEMGNAGLYTFSYVFLAGNPVSGSLLWKRGALTLAGFAVCGAILYAKHRSKHRELSFRSIVKQSRLTDPKLLWQLQLALGVGLLLGLGNLHENRRMMWAAFACGSVLGCYQVGEAGIRERFSQRIMGTLLGTGAYCLAYWLTPGELHSMFGLAGGLILGFCADYRAKTACNCLGALFIATSLFGLQDTVLLRLGHNLAGVVFGYLFWLLGREIGKKLRPTSAAQPVQGV